MDRIIVTFSILPADAKGKKEVEKLKKYSKKTGISFSFLMLKALTELNKELNLDN